MANEPVNEPIKQQNQARSGASSDTATQVVDLERRATSAQLSMKNHILVSALFDLGRFVPALTEFSKDKVLLIFEDDVPTPSLYRDLASCTTTLIKLLSTGLEDATQETLNDHLRQTEDCAATLQGIAKQFKRQIASLQGWASPKSDPSSAVDSAQDVEADQWHDQEDSHDAQRDESGDDPEGDGDSQMNIGQTNPAKAALDSWADMLDKMIFTMDLAVRDADLGTLADLVARFSDLRVCTKLPTYSTLLANPSSNSACAVHHIVCYFLDAMRELRNPPSMSPSLVAKTFKSDVETLVDEEHECWQYIEQLELYDSPVLVTERDGKIIFTLEAQEASLKSSAATWQRLRTNLQDLTSVLEHMGAGISIHSCSENDTVKYECTLTLPSGGKQVSNLSATGQKIRSSDLKIKRGQMTYPQIQDYLFGVGEPGKDSVLVLTPVKGLENPASRERLGKCIPGLARIAGALQIGQIVVSPSPRPFTLHSQKDDDQALEAFSTGNCAVVMTSERLPNNRDPRLAIDNLRDLAAYFARYAILGDTVTTIFSPPARVARQINLPLALLEDARAVRLLDELGGLTRIDGLDLTGHNLTPEHCLRILGCVAVLVSEAHKNFSRPLKTCLRCFITHSADDSPVIRVTIADHTYAPLTSYEVPLSLRFFTSAEYPTEELKDLYTAMHSVLSRLMDEQPHMIDVMTLRSELKIRGFDVCDELLNAVCQLQYRFDRLMNLECLSEFLLSYLTIKPADFLIRQSGQTGNRSRLAITSTQHAAWLKLQENRR